MYKCILSDDESAVIGEGESGNWLDLDETDARVKAWVDGKNIIPLARQALLLTDNVAIRCNKAGVTFPSAWSDWTESLREIIRGDFSAASSTLAGQPAFPTGT